MSSGDPVRDHSNRKRDIIASEHVWQSCFDVVYTIAYDSYGIAENGQ